MHERAGIIGRLARPEYLFRPAQILRWLARPTSGTHVVRLPWGLDLEVRADDAIGRAVLSLGVYDLALTEALWRLTAPDDVAVDGGANLGYASAVMAARAARVVAFEPHPDLAQRLEANTRRWGRRASPVEVHRFALDAHTGNARLVEGAGFSANEGTAHLADDREPASVSYDVETTTLDRAVGSLVVGVLKLDIEGHEVHALAGAVDLLGRRAIRDIVYEDHSAYPGAVSARLEEAGYRVFALGRTLRGPRLDAPGIRPGGGVEAPNYLATVDADRAVRKFERRGWECLSAKAISPKRPVLLRLMPDRLKEPAYYRRYSGERERWRALFAAAPLTYAPGITMELVPTDVAHGCIALTGFVELRLTRLVAGLAKEGGLLVDVGANAGYFSLVWAAARADNRAIAFEPSERNVALLRRNVARNGLDERVVVRPLALGRGTGTMAFDPGPADQTGWGGLSMSVTGTTVDVRRLDAVLEPNETVALLKIDAEGADAWVLEGCERLLVSGAVRRIVFEENLPRMAALGIAPGSAAAVLSRHGYATAPIGRATGELTEWEAWRG